LYFQKRKHFCSIVFVRVRAKHCFCKFFSACGIFGFKQNMSIFIAGIPAVKVAQNRKFSFKNFVCNHFHSVNCLPQRVSPFLIPARTSASRASAIPIPPANTVSAAPRRTLVIRVFNLHFIFWWILFQIPTVIHRNNIILRAEFLKKPCSTHIPKRLVVPIRFSVCSNGNKLVSSFVFVFCI